MQSGVLMRLSVRYEVIDFFLKANEFLFFSIWLLFEDSWTLRSKASLSLPLHPPASVGGLVCLAVCLLLAVLVTQLEQK